MGGELYVLAGVEEPVEPCAAEMMGNSEETFVLELMSTGDARFECLLAGLEPGLRLFPRYPRREAT